MARYLRNRIGQSLLLLLGVSVIGFALMHLAPGGPLAVYTLNPTVTAQDIERVKHQFGLDQPCTCNTSNGRPGWSPATGATASSADGRSASSCSNAFRRRWS